MGRSGQQGGSNRACIHLSMSYVLMIAFHFPPLRGSSGLQRTLGFARHLREYEWAPLVLSAHPGAYPATSGDQINAIPDDVPVKRAFALDTARHLALRGRYFDWMALPDRWVSWLPGALPIGLAMIRKYRPKLIWSTYPIATAHVIAWALHRLTGIPWVADFRDPMVECNPRTGTMAPPNRALRRARLWVERRCVRRAARIVLCTPGAKRICAERYPDVPATRWVIIPNGYEEADFSGLGEAPGASAKREGPLVLIHSGIIYPTTDRDPSALFDALASLRATRRISPATLRIVLRATAHDEHFRPMLKSHCIEDIVALAPAISYREALKEMCEADGLLVFQGYTSNPAIPAKIYEYLRAGKPIFAMVDEAGDTAALLRRLRVGIQVPLDDARQIAAGLCTYLDQLERGTAATTEAQAMENLSRASGARALALLFDEVASAAE